MSIIIACEACNHGKSANFCDYRYIFLHRWFVFSTSSVRQYFFFFFVIFSFILYSQFRCLGYWITKKESYFLACLEYIVCQRSQLWNLFILFLFSCTMKANRGHSLTRRLFKWSKIIIELAMKWKAIHVNMHLFFWLNDKYHTQKKEQWASFISQLMNIS